MRSHTSSVTRRSFSTNKGLAAKNVTKLGKACRSRSFVSGGREFPPLATKGWLGRCADALRYHLSEMRLTANLLTALALLVCLAPQSALAESVAGKWNLTWDTEGGIRHTVWEVEQDGDAVSVTTDGQDLEGTFKDGRLELSGKFYSSEAGYSAELKVEGTLENGQLKGRGSWDAYGMTFSGERAQ